jgi:hypothetical protein
VGAQLSEILNDQIDSKESGFSRRRVVKGVAWSVPVILTTAAAPPASASPSPTTPPTPPPVTPTGVFIKGTQNMPSSSSNGHERVGQDLPIGLNFKDLVNVAGEVKVILTITPTDSGSPVISPSAVAANSKPIAVTRLQNNQIQFSAAPAAGASVLDFAFSQYTYNGKKQSSGNYQVTTVVSFTKDNMLFQMNPGPSTSFQLPAL